MVWLQGDARGAAIEDGSLAAGIDKYERLGAGPARHGDELGRNPSPGKGFGMQCACRVIAHNAYVARGQAPLLASHHGGGDLATRQHAGRTVFDFGATRRKSRERDERIRRIQANTDKVNPGRLCHPASVN
jgi:hypothetical protein